MNRFSLSLIECDVLVAGGGPAGVACALAAARQGRKVVLCQDRPMLGGNASSEIRMHIVGSNSSRPCEALFLEPRETGIIEEIRLDNARLNPQRSPSMFDLILYDKCRNEPNLQLLLNTSVVGATLSGSRITTAHAVRASTEDRFDINAAVFVDCTGDGTLGAAAGAAFMEGREDKASFDESLACDQADGKRLGSTLLFMARRHDKEMPFIAPTWARKFTEDDLKLRRHASPESHAGLEYGYWWIEWGGLLDTIKDNEAIRDELLAIVMGAWDHVKNGGDHGASQWALDWFGFVPGKRESRRFIGQLVLTQKHLESSPHFADAIAYGGWPLDLHPPEGIDKIDELPCTQTHLPYLYDIPVRACVARDLENLMFAGRNISATHVAFASTRVMATCAVMGEGVGVAAAVASERGLAPSELAGNTAAMEEIQQRLLRHDLYLINRPLKDCADFALKALISASSETAEGPASNVISGQNRSVNGSRGVPEDRVLPGSHRWISDAKEGFPAWLELRWDAPIAAKELQLVFDTGLHRHLTLTHSDEYVALMQWKEGQPESARAYRIEVEVDGAWQIATEENDNWQRRRVHPLEASGITAVRIVVLSAWGVDHARIVRVSVY